MIGGQTPPTVQFQYKYINTHCTDCYTVREIVSCFVLLVFIIFRNNEKRTLTILHLLSPSLSFSSSFSAYSSEKSKEDSLKGFHNGFK
ncbi:hypothetical protein QYF36_013450 [Acer negundo]|nr:hypothetical protein QYF36_013450 [Acer negundo]